MNSPAIACADGRRKASTYKRPGRSAVWREHARHPAPTLALNGRVHAKARSYSVCISAIRDFVSAHNANPEPFVWTARTEQILEKVGRARRAFNKAVSA